MAKYSTPLAPPASELIPLSSPPPAMAQRQKNNRRTCFVLLGVTGTPSGDRCFLALPAPSLPSALPSVQTPEGESKEGEGRGPGKAKRTRKVVDRDVGEGGRERGGQRDGGTAGRGTEQRRIRGGTRGRIKEKMTHPGTQEQSRHITLPLRDSPSSDL